MALTKDKKTAVIDQVTNLLEDSKLTVFAKYQGTSVKSLQQLRLQARDNGTKIMVIKNRLFKKALAKDQRFKDTDLESLKGQLIYAFNAKDEVAPAQSLANFAKSEPQIEFVGALMADGQILAATDVKVLASLPSRDHLIAETIATLLAPLSNINSGLAGDLAGLLDGLAAKAS